MNTKRPTWINTETGYRLVGGEVEAELVKRGRSWFLIAYGREIPMPRRASFDHAERALATATH